MFSFALLLLLLFLVAAVGAVKLKKCSNAQIRREFKVKFFHQDNLPFKEKKSLAEQKAKNTFFDEQSVRYETEGYQSKGNTDVRIVEIRQIKVLGLLGGCLRH